MVKAEKYAALKDHRVCALYEAADDSSIGRALKYGAVLLTAGFATSTKGSILTLAFALTYLVLDITLRSHVLRLLDTGASVRSILGRITLHYVALGASFAAFASVIAACELYLLHLGALLLITGYVLHSLSRHAGSRHALLADVICVAIGIQAVGYFAQAWAEPMQSVGMHFALGLISAFYAFTAYEVYQTRQRLRDTSARLLTADRAGVMGRMAGGIAHDFNNLLTVMRGNLDLLDEVAPEERESLLKQVDEATVRGAELVARLSSAGHPDQILADVANLTTSTERAVNMARRTLPANVRIKAQTLSPTVYVRANAAQLEMALLNLLLNGRDALPKGGSIEVITFLEEDGLVCLSVSDDGIGMSPEVLARATEAYSTTKVAGTGTGLGLSMVKSFVEDARGRLDIRSVEGEGTRVCMRLFRTSAVAGPVAAE